MSVPSFEGEAGPDVKVGTAGWGAEGELDLAKLALTDRP